MVEILGTPLIVHIMKHYANNGFKKFLIATGYKGEIIKNILIKKFDWDVKVIQTGQKSMTGGRLERLKKFVGKYIYDDIWRWCIKHKFKDY